MPPTSQRSIIIGLIFVGVLIVGFFGLHAFFAFWDLRRHGHPPQHAISFTENIAGTDLALIRDWMTVPYISQIYHLPAHMLFDAMGIPPRGNETESLKQLNEKFFPREPNIVIELLKVAIQAYQAAPAMQRPNVPGLPQTPTLTTPSP